MQGKTHLAAGMAVSLFICPDLPTITICCFGSLLPDIDHSGSWLGKSFPVFGKMFKHRGFTHSLLFSFLCFLASEYLAVGISIHIFLDMMTNGGVQFLFPYRKNLRFPFARFARTGGKLDKTVFLLSSLGCVAGLVSFLIF